MSSPPAAAGVSLVLLPELLVYVLSSVFRPSELGLFEFQVFFDQCRPVSSCMSGLDIVPPWSVIIFECVCVWRRMGLCLWDSYQLVA